jgi:hypothetical protein
VSTTPDAYPAQAPARNKSRNPVATSEPGRSRNPKPRSEPPTARNPAARSEPSSARNPEPHSEPRNCISSPDAIPFSLRQQRDETYRRVNHWRARNPERARALGAVANAIRNYEIERGTSCARCGSKRNIVAGDISLHPLRVVWRCRRCSNAQRRQARSLSARHAAQARRQRQLFRRTEAARIAERQFWIRVERAVMVIARTGADTAVACRAVGLHNSAKAQKAVQALCDQRNIPRRYWWRFPRWKTQTPQPVTVNRHRKEIVRPRDEENR